ncbi:MAG: hypothetical protein AOA66_1011 [Candidatus Bathyarchaeota archaeon BA2]|nr:MAG: hypothetical protein AOA66_1011 [Candidatus Bathyarchaeota archaeon BA2]
MQYIEKGYVPTNCLIYATYFDFIKPIYLGHVQGINTENGTMGMHLTSKSGVIICPNPKCQREIEEPILLNNLSKTPAEQYYACPRCLIKLDMDAENEKEIVKETAPSPPVIPSLEKVLDVISARPQKEKREDREEAPKVKPPKEEKEEKGPERRESPKGCPHHFGYLAHRPKDASIPQECLTCNKIVECMLKV